MESLKFESENLPEETPSNDGRLETLDRELELLLPALTEAEEVRNRTDELEARLERESGNSIYERGKFDNLKRGGKKLFYSLLATGALLESSPSDAANAPEKHRDPREAFIAQVAKETGFGEHLSVDAGNGKFIIHIKQWHDTSYNRTNTQDRLKVVEIQKSIEQFLSQTVKKDSKINTAFGEGHIVENEKYFQEMWNGLRNTLDDIKPESGAYLDLRYCLEKYRTKFEENPRVTAFINYLFRKKLNALNEAFKRKPLTFSRSIDENFFTRTRNEALVACLGKQRSESADGMDYYFYGGAEKLSLDKKINFKSAETRAGNVGITEDDNTLKSLQDAFQRATPKEKLSIAAKIKETEAVQGRKIYDDRERIAIELIEKFCATNNQPLIPMVYGNAHDFRKELLKYNFEHPKQKIGLIEVTPPLVMQEAKKNQPKTVGSNAKF